MSGGSRPRSVTTRSPGRRSGVDFPKGWRPGESVMFPPHQVGRHLVTATKRGSWNMLESVLWVI